MHNNDNKAWIKKYDPQKRLLSEKTYLKVKRIFDLTLVMITSPIWIAVLLLVGLMIILTSPGAPVFYFQYRTGKDGQRFKMYKFRTMVPNAEELKQKYMHLNELNWPDFKITNDPRVTPLGNLLRRSSLDELPQLFNVLKGDMSLVGPRPTSFGAETYKLWHTGRLDVIPGLTGLWQVIGRASLEFDERLRLDIAYIERRSIWFDIVIIFKTIESVLKRKGAH